MPWGSLGLGQIVLPPGFLASSVLQRGAAPWGGVAAPWDLVHESRLLEAGPPAGQLAVKEMTKSAVLLCFGVQGSNVAGDRFGPPVVSAGEFGRLSPVQWWTKPHAGRQSLALPP